MNNHDQSIKVTIIHIENKKITTYNGHSKYPSNTFGLLNITDTVQIAQITNTIIFQTSMVLKFRYFSYNE